MLLTDTWAAYNDGDYPTSLRLSAQALVDSAGIDHLHIAGLSLISLHRVDEGLALLNAAVTMRPQEPHIYTNAAFLAEQTGLPQQAEYFADLGLRDFPENTDLLLLKANSLVMQMRFDAAVPVYHHLLDRDPANVQSMINLGNICRANDDFEQAQRWFDRAEANDPEFRDLLFARATMYTQMGDDRRAVQLLEQIAADVDAQFLLSLLYLSSGDYERGFRLYRSRGYSVWATAGKFAQPTNSFDHWSETAGKTVAVIPEGGYGDLLQFVRYIPLLAQVAKAITLCVPAALTRLLDQMPANVSLAPTDSYDPTAFDYVTTTVEMPYHFRTTLETIPDTIPYLSVPASAIARRRLPPTDMIRVGLCWAGGTQDGFNQRSYDSRRSFDLAVYAPLGRIAGIEFVSLQMGQRAEQVRVDLPLQRPLDASFDFLDTAAIIAQLDLVISVDTSIVHLAAAIGKPVWVLSRYDACWRWLHNRSDSPWYPGVLRVFGQKRYNDWSDPINEVVQALKDFRP
jgi:tetratricopeptide (TPR) repeat protein